MANEILIFGFGFMFGLYLGIVIEMSVKPESDKLQEELNILKLKNEIDKAKLRCKENK